MSTSFTLIHLTLTLFSLGYSSPVFLWQAAVSPKPVYPHIKKEEFLNEIQPLVDSKTIVAFIYSKLAIKSLQCKTCLPYLSQQTPSFLYAHVKTPTTALKSLNSTTTKALDADFDGNLNTDLECKPGNLYMISLDNLSAKDKPLESCDSAIKEIVTSLKCPEALFMFMGTRDDLNIPGGQLFQANNFSFYLTQLEYRNTTDGEILKVTDMNVTGEYPNITVQLETNVTAKSIQFAVLLYKGYFEIKSFIFDNYSFHVHDLYAPLDNSYSCGKITLERDKMKLIFKMIQIQYDRKQKIHFKFENAWTCEGFTTPAIISGIFVTAILVTILSIGISMLFNVQTPSKFDNIDGHRLYIHANY